MPEHKTVFVCQGTGCVSGGSDAVYEALKAEVARQKLPNVEVDFTGCHGFCEQGPNVIIEPEGVFYTHVQVEDAPEIVGSHLRDGKPVERLFYREPATGQSVAYYSEINFYKKQQRVVLRNCGHINPEKIDDYIARRGYRALRKALLMTPEEVIEEIKKSGLRGRGGAGFPTGRKWEFCRNAPGDTKYVICNADEGDPGAFMDRSILEADPHAVIEGLTIAGYAIGASEGYIYLRAEYPLAVKRFRIALEQAKERGFLGDNGGMVVLDDATCMVEIARYFLSFTQDECCGKCAPGRLGTRQMLEILTRITEGKGRDTDIDTLLNIAMAVKECSLCGLGQTCPNPVLTTIKYFRDEYEAHIKEKKCPAAVCDSLMISPCQHTCPVGINIPKYVAHIAAGEYKESIDTIRERNPFPAICGRICHHPCEGKCRRGELDEPVAIRSLKRFVADWYFDHVAELPPPESFPRTKAQKVAVVGAGPTGLSCAYYLAQMGYGATVFEALPVGGGMLSVAIPEFRLPQKVIQQEIDYIANCGVDIRYNTPIDVNFTVEDLKKDGFAAVFVAAGAQRSQRIGIPGELEDIEGFHYGLRFLRDVKVGKEVRIGRRVAVIGGGNVARRRPVPIAGSEFFAEADMVVAAVGQAPDLSFLPRDSALERTRWETLAVDDNSLSTNVPGVFAGGDFVTGPGMVIDAIAAGRRGALAIDKYLKRDTSRVEMYDLKTEVIVEATTEVEEETWEAQPRLEVPTLPAEERKGSFEEIELSFSEEKAIQEAKRCLRCDLEK